MAPSAYPVNGASPSPFLAPTSDNRGLPPRKASQSSQSAPANDKQHWSHARGMSRLARPLTVNEALPYSPLSSIAPFDTGIIPQPSSDVSYSYSTFLSSSEQQASRRTLELLDSDIAHQNGKSQRVDQAVHFLQPLLDQSGTCEFIFKHPPGFKDKTSDSHSSDLTANERPASNPLGHFANMVLAGTDVPHRYPTPSSIDSSPQKARTPPSRYPPKLPATPTSPEATAKNQGAHSRNNLSLDLKAIQVVTPQQPKLHPVVLVPPLPPASQPSDYKVYQDERRREKIKSEGSRKRKRDEGDGDILPAQIRDQRAISDEALRSLQELIRDILDAEDQAQVDDSNIASTDKQDIFIRKGDDGGTLLLAPAILVKLEASLAKTISLGRLGEIPVDHLFRLQKLCEAALVPAESIDITLDPNWDEAGATQWLDRLDAAELGLRSARTVVRTMVGGREEKQLYSEELLQKVLELVRKVMDSCLIPVVESRATGSNSEIFQPATTHKKVLSQLMHNAAKVLQLLQSLSVRVELAETTVNGLEFFAERIIFVESAHTEKDSVLGIAKFEAFRRTAMDITAEIFSRYPEQRRSIFDEILTSLQKLPTTRQHARQFKLKDGKSIQLVSALIMRLVQTSGMRAMSTKRTRRQTLQSERKRAQTQKSDSEDCSDGDGFIGETSDESEDSAHTHSRFAIQRLHNSVQKLNQDSERSAQYVIGFFVQRASTASKTGDQPHRHLLDIFSEDLMAVLGFPEWPAAELLLRALLHQMIRVIDQDKSTAPAKNMALELLGLMGSGITDLAADARHLAKVLESDDAEFSGYLIQLMDDQLGGRCDEKELLEWTGPYRAVMEYLHRSDSESPQTTSALGYQIMQWAKTLCSSNQAGSEEEGDTNVDRNIGEIASKLRKMLSNMKWRTQEDFQAISANQCRLAYILIVLSMGFCRGFDHIVKILMGSISGDQITVRTRSLKSVTQMLEKDPTLLDRAPNVIRLIIKSASDQSPLVRDSALLLMGKCVVLKPALEQEIYRAVLVCASDNAIGVRKRSMKMLKDIYLRSSLQDVKVAIADSIMQRSKDTDEGVSELARQIFEEIWLSPFWSFSKVLEESAEAKVTLRNHIAFIVKTVQRSHSTASLLETILRRVLSSNSKSGTANFQVCKAIVALAFENFVDINEVPGKSQQSDILSTLTVFGKANPKLFTASQLQLLQPYIGNLSSVDDLNLFRSVVLILRNVLPTLSSVQHEFLKDIQNDLLRSVPRLGKLELNEVVACLWTINMELHNIEKIVNLVKQVLNHMHNLEAENLTDPDKEKTLDRVGKYVRIAGCFGKHCDFESQLDAFKQFKWWSGNSVAGFIIRSIKPFASPKQPLSLKLAAISSIGLVCQAWPKQFILPDIVHTFRDILKEGHRDLQDVVLLSFREFFATQDRQFADMNGIMSGGEGQKLGGSMTASDKDEAAALIAQSFLKEILRIALVGQDDYALTAVEVVASINRQGLVHPKECGPALVALETSTNSKIADIAFEEHRNLHQQHESMFEREYARAIHQAFLYQKTIVRDSLGAMGSPPVAKLYGTFEAVKTSKSKYQKKFLSNICAKIDFEPNKLDLSARPPAHLEYARFLTENLAFFEYGRVDELQHIISCMEKLVASTGAGIAHAISTEVFNIRVESSLDESMQDSKMNGDTASSPLNKHRFLQLTTGSMILSIVWDARTFLRRLYGLNSNQQRRDNKAKQASKDLNKAPTKTHGVTGDRLMESIRKTSNALQSPETMQAQCKAFLDLLSIDEEVKVAAEDDNASGTAETPGLEDDRDTLMQDGHSTRGGSIGTNETGATPQKKKRSRPLLGRRKSGKSVDMDSDSY